MRTNTIGKRIKRKAVRSNRLFFKYYKRRHYKNYKVDPSLTAYRNELDALCQDGIVVLDAFFDADVVDSVVEETRGQIEQLKINEYSDTRFHYKPEYGVYRLMDVDTISPTSRLFFENDLVTSLAKAYVSERVTSYQRMIESRPDPGRTSTADAYHFDDWTHRFKAFLYLTDVTEENGPFVYLKKSHLPGEWRAKKEFEYQKYGREGNFGHFFLHEVELLKKKYHFDEVVCVAKKGTLIMVDARGIHRGTPILTGERLLLANYFDVRE